MGRQNDHALVMLKACIAVYDTRAEGETLSAVIIAQLSQKYRAQFVSLNISLSHSKLLKVINLTVPFDSLGKVFSSRSILTMALSCIISDIKRYVGRKLRFDF